MSRYGDGEEEGKIGRHVRYRRVRGGKRDIFRSRDVSRKWISRGRSIDRSRGLFLPPKGRKERFFLGKIEEAKRCEDTR